MLVKFEQRHACTLHGTFSSIEWDSKHAAGNGKLSAEPVHMLEELVQSALFLTTHISMGPDSAHTGRGNAY